MFKSKFCNTRHQCLHDINSMNPPCLLSSQKPPTSSAPAGEERSPGPKPRWNPKPEQIKILESIFNSGMVNPSRDEIRRIRGELQEFGQVGDASVFYWFQNRKSRSKHKLRNAAATARSQPRSAVPSISTLPVTTTNSSSSSSSELSTVSDQIHPPPVSLMNISSLPTASVNQTNFPCPVDFSGEPFFFQGRQGLWSELMLHHGSPTTAVSANSAVAPLAAAAAVVAGNIASNVNEIQGFESAITCNPVLSNVLVNGVAYEVVSIPINVLEVFGNDAVLLGSNYHPVLVDEYGTTLHPLEDGASYFLV